MNMLRRLWRGRKAQEPDTENPYVRGMLLHDLHEQDLQRAKRDRGLMAAGLFLLLATSVSGNLYQVQQAKEFHHFVLLDRDYQPVQALTQRADLMGENDPIRNGITAEYVKNYVTHRYQIMMDKQFLADSLNLALSYTAGTAALKFKPALISSDPFKRSEKEKVIVKVEGTPVKVSANSWFANWTEEVRSPNGDVLREEKKNGYFRVAQDPKRVSTDNIFGLAIADTEVK